MWDLGFEPRLPRPQRGVLTTIRIPHIHANDDMLHMAPDFAYIYLYTAAPPVLLLRDCQRWGVSCPLQAMFLLDLVCYW